MIHRMPLKTWRVQVILNHIMACKRFPQYCSFIKWARVPCHRLPVTLHTYCWFVWTLVVDVNKNISDSRKPLSVLNDLPILQKNDQNARLCFSLFHLFAFKQCSSCAEALNRCITICASCIASMELKLYSIDQVLKQLNIDSWTNIRT